jgi:hypothetical protein
MLCSIFGFQQFRNEIWLAFIISNLHSRAVEGTPEKLASQFGMAERNDGQNGLNLGPISVLCSRPRVGGN